VSDHNSDNPSDDDVDRQLEALLPDLSWDRKRRRGRPRTGISNAWDYDRQFWELIHSGMPPTKAVREVARRNGKVWRNGKVGLTEQHIWHCRKLIADALDSGDFLEWDPVEGRPYLESPEPPRD